MSSVADALRARTRAQVLALSTGERIRLALRLGDDDLDLFVAATGGDRDHARRELRARRGSGRRASVANLAVVR